MHANQEYAVEKLALLGCSQEEAVDDCLEWQVRRIKEEHPIYPEDLICEGSSPDQNWEYW